MGEMGEMNNERAPVDLELTSASVAAAFPASGMERISASLTEQHHQPEVVNCADQEFSMRLLTHNLLACHARTCTTTSNNFPLAFKDVQIELIEAEFNDDFLRGFIPKIEWPALVGAARQVSGAQSGAMAHIRVTRSRRIDRWPHPAWRHITTRTEPRPLRPDGR